MKNKKYIIYYPEINGDSYMRTSSDNWYIRLGESWEPIYWEDEIKKLENEFQKQQESKP